MANEVIISEYGENKVITNGQISEALGPLLTSQVLTTSAKSEAFNAKTEVIKVTVKSDAAAAVWVKIGDTSVSAVANTAGNEYIAKGGSVLFKVKGGQFIDTAADA